MTISFMYFKDKVPYKDEIFLHKSLILNGNDNGEKMKSYGRALSNLQLQNYRIENILLQKPPYLEILC